MTAIPISLLEPLVTMVVTRAEMVHDYIQMAFGPGTVLSIFNDWKLSPENFAFGDLIGSRLIKVQTDRDAVVFEFDCSAKLVVNLSTGAWHGPEALELDRRGFPTVVWN